MKSTTKRTQRDYSLAFKLTVVDEVEKGSLTYKVHNVIVKKLLKMCNRGDDRCVVVPFFWEVV